MANRCVCEGGGGRGVCGTIEITSQTKYVVWDDRDEMATCINWLHWHHQVWSTDLCGGRGGEFVVQLKSLAKPSNVVWGDRDEIVVNWLHWHHQVWPTGVGESGRGHDSFDTDKVCHCV